MTIDLPWDEELAPADIEPEARRVGEELIIATDTLELAASLRFLRTLIATLQAEERALASSVEPGPGRPLVM